MLDNVELHVTHWITQLRLITLGIEIMWQLVWKTYSVTIQTAHLPNTDCWTKWTDVHYSVYNRSYWITQGQMTDFRTTGWDVAGIFTPSPYPTIHYNLWSHITFCHCVAGSSHLYCQFWCLPSITITDLWLSPSSHIQMLYCYPTFLFSVSSSFLSLLFPALLSY